MTEMWVHPVTEGREAGPDWVPRWRFRLVALLLLAIGVVVVIVGYHYYSGAGSGTKINAPQISRAMPSEHFTGYGDNRLGA